MIWGQKQYLNAYQYKLWQTTGLLHLLVLSGQNITLLVGFFNILVKKLGTKYQVMVTFLVAGFYLVVFGSEPPIIRSCLMAILAALVLYQQTTTPPIFLLFLTSATMLFFKPEWLTSLSFQLSFGATLGILWFYPIFQTKYKFKSELASMFFVSLSAQIFTTPLLLIYFRQISLLVLPINVVVGLLVEPIMLVGVLTSLSTYLIPILTPIFSLVLFGLLSLLNMIVENAYPISMLFQLKI